MHSFIVGSRAYGTPRDDSDVDLVVYLTMEDLEILRSVIGTPEESAARTENDESDGKGEISSGSFRIGNLNLIAVTKLSDVEIWRKGTQFLKASSPVTRDEAIAHFRMLRKQNDSNLYDLF